jgi:hypothetical protein
MSSGLDDPETDGSHRHVQEDLRDHVEPQINVRIERDATLPDPLTHTCRGPRGCGTPLQNVDVKRHVEHHRKLAGGSYSR